MTTSKVKNKKLSNSQTDKVSYIEQIFSSHNKRKNMQKLQENHGIFTKSFICPILKNSQESHIFLIESRTDKVNYRVTSLLKNTF